MALDVRRIFIVNPDGHPGFRASGFLQPDVKHL